MATAAKKPAAANDEPDNLAIWNELAKTDPAHTKSFKRAGGFSGTAIRPMWVVKRLTEIFGPCGKGWGIGEPQFQVVSGDNREILVFCTVTGWYDAGDPGKLATVHGVGGDKVVTHIKANEQYKRPERWENDDEAFKKAFTDAVGNAFKFVGVGADVHMGQFDDSKYVAQVAAEFAEANGEAKIPGIHKLKDRLRGLMTAGDLAPDLDSFNALVKANADDLTKIKEANHSWWTGDGEDFEGYKAWIVRRREELSEDGVVTTMIQTLKSCDTMGAVTAWLATNGDAVEALDGAESRRFQLAYDLHLSAIEAMDSTTIGA